MKSCIPLNFIHTVDIYVCMYNIDKDMYHDCYSSFRKPFTMVQQSQKDKFEMLIRGTVLSLCQNVLEHKSHIKVDLFIGISVDDSENFHFSIVETLKQDDTQSGGPSKNIPRESRSLAPTATQPPDVGEQVDGFGKPRHTLEALLRAGPTKTREKETTRGGDAADGEDSTSLSYSNLLRSFGEMSRQQTLESSDDSPSRRPVSDPQPARVNLSDPQPARVNQAQVVIPINFAIHSPSAGQPAASAHSAVDSDWSFSSPATGKHSRPGQSFQDHSRPDISGVETKRLKVKEEVISDDDSQERSNSGQYPGPDTTTDGQGHSIGQTEGTPDTQKKGILLSLLSEESHLLKYQKVGPSTSATSRSLV